MRLSYTNLYKTRQLYPQNPSGSHSLNLHPSLNSTNQILTLHVCITTPHIIPASPALDSQHLPVLSLSHPLYKSPLISTPKMPLQTFHPLAIMYLLQSPLEALAFRYSAALAGSAWTWLAVVFAALGFWRIRLVGSKIKPDLKPEPPQVAAKPTEAVIVGPNDDTDLPMRRCHVERKGDPDYSPTKGRFTAYFHVEDNGHGYECDGVSDVDHEEEETPLWRPEGMRGPLWRPGGLRGDLGWYRYVDLTAIDGSVVRLWDRYGDLRRRV